MPLSLGGAFVGLLIAQKSFSMPSLIGLIMLMGIPTKNSILLVEYAIVARRGNDGSNGHPVLVPAVFTYIDDIERGFRRLTNRLRGRKEPPEAGQATLAAAAKPAQLLAPCAGGSPTTCGHVDM